DPHDRRRRAGAPVAAQPVVRYQHDNQIGLSVLELDATGQPISREEDHPFGTTAFYQAPSVAGQVVIKRHRYIGQEREDETGFYYLGARYTAPWLGRFLSVDPSDNSDGREPYVYVGDNPVKLVDPDGRDKRPYDITTAGTQLLAPQTVIVGRTNVG